MGSPCKKTFSFAAGKPGAELRREAARVLLVATEHRLKAEIAGDAPFIINACTKTGNPEFRTELAKFLTEEYGDLVSSDSLLLTSGATQGLHIALTLLVGYGSPVFMEEPTYFYATGIVKECDMKGVPVQMDEDGICVDDLEVKVKEWQEKQSWNGKPNDKPYHGMIYVIPTFHNPTGRCYSPARCRALIKLAREYNLLVFCEDVYNLLYYTGDSPPRRMFSYDHRSDPDYVGSVISNGSFSKLLGAGMRLGWYEGPTTIIDRVKQSDLVGSGGPLNQLGSGFILSALKLGVQQAYVRKLRETYGRRMKTCCKFLREHLPNGCSVNTPQGGYFIWLQLPEHVDNSLIIEKARTEYNCEVRDGRIFSQVGGFGNCLRLSVAFIEDEDLMTALTVLSDAINKYLIQSDRL